ncbi:MAG TPA: hypothetical protein VMT12_03210 [Syntrophales bacterium]|nr:hypothetical protein [Syntrophales bacterium]
MLQLSKLKKIIIPAAALLVGLTVGLGIGQFQVKKEQRISQEKIKEAGKKIAYIQKKMADEKNEATVSLEKKCQEDIEKLQNEKKALGGQVGKLKEQMQNLETKIKESDESYAKTKKELQETERKYAKAAQHNKELDRDLKKVTGEREYLQSELKKTTKALGNCKSNNAELCVIAEDLVKKYRNKGVGASLLEKEPLLQVKKIELEQITQKYQEEIEQLKIKKR